MNSSLDYTRVAYGYESIYGYKGGGLNRVANELKNYNLSAVLETCSKISLTLFSKSHLDQETQIKLTKDLFRKNLYVRQRLVAAVQEGGDKGWAIFTEQTVLVLVKLALTNCKKNSGKSVTDLDIDRVGHWLLIITDECMGSVLTAPLVLPPSYEMDYARRHYARQHFLMDQERINNRIARFTFMFNFIKERYPDFDINKQFALATEGASFEEYTHLCFYLVVEWFNRRNREVDIAQEWITCWTKYFSETSLDKKLISKIKDLLLLDIKNYSRNYENEVKKTLNGEDYFTYNFLQLKRTPFIPINEDCFVCPSPDFLMEKVTEGVYWVLENYFKAKKLNSLHTLLPIIWGDSFENYISQCFESGFGNDKYIPNVSSEGKEKLDGLLNLESIFCLVEIKYAHWTFRAKVSGESQSMMITLKQLFSSKKGLGQIVKSIKEINEGGWTLPFEIGSKKMLPIIVIGESMPMDMLNYKLYEDFARKEKMLLKQDNLLPFIILDAEEVEIIEALVKTHGINFIENLLIEYSMVFTLRTEKGYAGGAMAFKNFLHSKSITSPNNERLLDVFDQVSNDARQRAFPDSKPFSREIKN